MINFGENNMKHMMVVLFCLQNGVQSGTKTWWNIFVTRTFSHLDLSFTTRVRLYNKLWVKIQKWYFKVLQQKVSKLWSSNINVFSLTPHALVRMMTQWGTHLASGVLVNSFMMSLFGTYGPFFSFLKKYVVLRIHVKQNMILMI